MIIPTVIKGVSIHLAAVLALRPRSDDECVVLPPNSNRPSFTQKMMIRDQRGSLSATALSSTTAPTAFVNEYKSEDDNNLISKQQQQHAASSTSALSMLATGGIDVRRFDILVNAGPGDFTGLVQEIPNDNLDWETTIFYTITDPALTERLKDRFGQRPLWPDSVIRDACRAALSLPSRQYAGPPAAVREFVNANCEFKNEHADGGFQDHLDFCAEYCCRYFPAAAALPSSSSTTALEVSPNVLYLHSVCGVNTNLFPLDFNKIPDLQGLFTDHEYLHVQAFPCMLRLLFAELMDVLWEYSAAAGAPLDDQTAARMPAGITITAFHGTKLTLRHDELYVHLNYQLIHLLDFLPVQRYQELAVYDGFIRLFLRLHEYLRSAGKLWADVRLDRLSKAMGMTAAATGDGKGRVVLPTWEYLMAQVDNPEKVDIARDQLAAQMRLYSAAIQHDLSYELHWE